MWIPPRDAGSVENQGQVPRLALGDDGQLVVQRDSRGFPASAAGRRLAFHDDAENPVDTSLIPPAVRFQPSEHIGIEADRELLLCGRPRDGCLRKKLVSQGRDIRIVDGSTIQPPRFGRGKLPRLLGIEFITFDHIASVRARSPSEPKSNVFIPRVAYKPPEAASSIMPRMIRHSSSCSCRSSPLSRWWLSRNTRAACANGTPCLTRFRAAFAASHSNSTHYRSSRGREVGRILHFALLRACR